MGLNSRLVDFLEYFKHQALVGILMSSLGFMEAYFLLALVSRKSVLICCLDFIDKAFS